MLSSFSGLNAVLRGLYSQQIALNTVGQNITNANTAGYSRQTANLTTATPEAIYAPNGSMQVGTGVDVSSITRARDSFTDQQLWQELSNLGNGEAGQELLGQIERVFNEPTESGMQSVLDEFWSALQAVGSNASDEGARTVLLQRGVQLADTITHAGQQLADINSGINDDLKIKIDSLNQITENILVLNKQIVNIEVNGDNANDLRDQRDLLVDELSKLAKVTVYEDAASNYNIQMQGLTLVDATRTTQLTTQADLSNKLSTYYGLKTDTVVVADEFANPVTFTNGEIKGLLDGRDSDVSGLVSYLDNLDTMSEFLLTDFNVVHKQGYGLDDSTGVNFFGAAGVDYKDSAQDPAKVAGGGGWLNYLAMNPELLADGGLDIVAARTTLMQGEASGDNAVKLAQALRVNVRDSSVLADASYDAALGSATLDSFYQKMIGTLGAQKQNIDKRVDNQQVVVDQISKWRESVSGVNLDEEMANMIRYQQGYNAAARMVTVIDEMLDKLINGTGVVGR